MGELLPKDQVKDMKKTIKKSAKKQQKDEVQSRSPLKILNQNDKKF